MKKVKKRATSFQLTQEQRERYGKAQHILRMDSLAEFIRTACDEKAEQAERVQRRR